MPYNVANNLRVAMPDPIGVDQLKRKNVLADTAMQADQQRNALYGQQIAQNDSRMKADEQSQALERVRQWAPGAIAQARAGQIAPFVQAGQQLGVIDPNRDPATVTADEVEEFATQLGIGPAQQAVPFERTPEGIKFAESRRQFDQRMGMDRQQNDQRLALDREKLSLAREELSRPPAPSSIDQDRIYRGEDRMKNDFEQVTKDRREELSAARKVRQLAVSELVGKNGRLSPQSQQALIFMFGKVLDPASVLREGEYDRIAKARGYYDTASLMLDKVAAGDLLTKKQINDIAAIAGFYEKAAEISVKSIASEYEGIAGKRGYDSAAIISDPTYRSQFAPGAKPARKSAQNYLEEAQRGR